MKKKGIILLITIFFIFSITALYLKNLNDSDRLIKSSQNIYHMNYIIKIIDDVNQIIDKLSKSLQLYDSETLEITMGKLPGLLPLSYNNVAIDLSLSTFTTICDINHLYDINNTEEKLTCENLFGNDFNNFSAASNQTYNNILSDLNISKIENNKQKNYIIDTFFKDNNYYSKIDSDTLKENISFVSDTNSSTYLKCDYTISISDEKIASVNTIYKLEANETKVFDLEINFQ